MPSADDPRVLRARAIAGELEEASARVLELGAERRALLVQLRAEAMSMQALADAVGIGRQRLYEIIGPISESDQRKRGPRPAS